MKLGNLQRITVLVLLAVVVLAVTLLAVALLAAGVVVAQSPSRLESLADTLRAARTPSDPALPPAPPPSDLPAKRATLRDPLQSPNDFVSQPPTPVNPIPAFATNTALAANPSSAALAPSTPLFGNPRDPLGSAILFKVPTQIVSPYIEAIDDATLRDVAFISPLLGWAVGDHGAVWHTRDGGVHWQLQVTPIDATLHSVHFIDAASGLAVGGYTLPITGEGRGVVLATTDGGQNWHRVATGVPLPILTSVRVNTPLEAEATGMFSESLRASRFRSRDRGATWEPLATDNATSVDPPSLTTSQTEIAAGGFVPRATAAVGEHRWMAGRPGTRILHSSDAGKTWSETPTGVHTTIERLAFIDRENGWGVGGLGTILRTRDGGLTWETQRQSGKRLAVLVVVATEEEIPWELLTKLAAEEGYRCGVSVIFPRDELSPLRRSRVVWSQRLADAVARTGAVLLPLPTSEERAAFCSASNASTSTNGAIQRHIVRAIRQERPEVIVTSDVASRRDESQLTAVRQAVEEAIREASDPTRARGEKSLGLDAWSIRKLLLAMPRGVHGATMVAAHEPLPRLGLALADGAWESRSLLGTEMMRLESPSMIGFQVATTSPETTTHPSDPLAGITLLPDSGARRAFHGTELASLERAQVQQQLREELIDRLETYHRAVAEMTIPASSRQLVSAIEATARRLDPDVVAKILWKWSDTLHRRGEWHAASLELLALVALFPNHPLAHPACERLAVYFSSEEAAMRMLQSDAASIAAVRTIDRQRESFEQWLETQTAELLAFPEIRFPMIVGQRRSGWENEATRLYRSRAHLATQIDAMADAWSQRAAAEVWLAERTTHGGKECPLPTLVCSHTTRRPYLDAQFDDPTDGGVWFESRLHRLTAGDASAPETHCMFLYDREYLYIALRCRMASHFSYLPSQDDAPRQRDSDLLRSDRVEIAFDVDRDWVSAYTLAVDYRGWVHDACWGDGSWNPDWYVAREMKDGYWFIEAAIPITSLTRTSPTRGSVWAVGVRRVVPGATNLSWHGRATDPPEESLGLMVFE